MSPLSVGFESHPRTNIKLVGMLLQAKAYLFWIRGIMGIKERQWILGAAKLS